MKKVYNIESNRKINVYYSSIHILRIMRTAPLIWSFHLTVCVTISQKTILAKECYRTLKGSQITTLRLMTFEGYDGNWSRCNDDQSCKQQFLIGNYRIQWDVFNCCVQSANYSYIIARCYGNNGDNDYLGNFGLVLPVHGAIQN